MAHAHVDVEALSERLGGVEQQLVPFGDDSADVVRQTAVGIRNVGAAFEDDDVGRFVEATDASGRRGAAGHTADDEMLHKKRGMKVSSLPAVASRRAPQNAGREQKWDY